MAEAQEKELKTEEPTEKRISESREKGRTAKSVEVNSLLILLTALVFFTFFGMEMIYGVLRIFRYLLTDVATFTITTESVIRLFTNISVELAYVVLPFMFTIAAMGVISNFYQNDGWIFSWDPISPKFNKISPLSGWGKIFGKEGLVKLVQSLVKIAIIGFVVWYSSTDEFEKIGFLMSLPIEQTFMMLGDETFWLIVKVLMAMLLISVTDFIYQKWSYKEGLKMTKQEIKDERKQIEGDPLIKQRIKDKQFEMFRKRMMSQVPEAEVIITNPTHLSVAIRYDRNRDFAPIVVAKGAGAVAMKIREIAKEHDIPIMENRPVAQTLFKNVDIGSAIPESLYKAVADILAYVYRLKNNTLITEGIGQ